MLYASAVDHYINVCKASGKSHNTLESYSRTLRFFGQYLEASGVCSLESVTPDLLSAWKLRAAQSLSPASLRLYVTHLKCFFDFCRDIEFVTTNPFKKRVMEVAVKDSDRKDTLTHVLTPHQFRAIFQNDSPRHMHRSAIARNRAILAILITSGIRCESLCRLTQRDLDPASHSIRIQNAKGGKNGSVLLSDLAIRSLAHYRQSCAALPTPPPPDGPLFGFVTASGSWSPYSRAHLSAVVEAAVRGFTGAAGFRSHAMRHTCASLLSASGLSDGEISTLLFHSDGTGAQVTNRYIARDSTALFHKANAAFETLLGGGQRQAACQLCML